METEQLQAAYDALKTMTGQTIQVRAHKIENIIYVDLLEWRDIRWAVAKCDILTLELDRKSFYQVYYSVQGTTTVDAVIEKLNQLRYFKIAHILA